MNNFFTAILYHVNYQKQLLFRRLKGTVIQETRQKYMITSTERASPENFTLTASPI